MAVTVIDTIKPKNQGTFPVVEAQDVKVTDSKRLDAALNEKASQSDVAALQTAVAGKASQSDLTALSNTVSGKQNALTEEQLTAVNSGITSELVTQIGTNTTAIASKASQSDLDTTNATVATKANTSDVNTSVSNLQNQIDAIVTPVTQDAEVENARVGVDGTSYQTLKARLDTEMSKTVREKGAPSDTDCDLILDNGVYQLNTTYSNAPTGMSQNGVLVVLTSGNKSTRLVQMAFEYNSPNLWTRARGQSNTFASWSKIPLFSDLTVLDEKALTIKTTPSDLDDCETGIYTIGTTQNVAHAPSHICAVISIYRTSQSYQLAFDAEYNKVWFRNKINNTWTEWDYLLKSADFNPLFDARLLPSLQEIFDDKFVIKEKNLFDGNYVTNIKLGGSPSIGGSYTISSDSGFNSLAVIPVKPNTRYSIIVADEGAESGYYYLKITTIQDEILSTADLIGMSNENKFSETSAYVKNKTIITGEDDTYLLVQSSKSKQPFLQIYEGVITDFTVETYETSYTVEDKGSENKKVYISYSTTNTYEITFGEYTMNLFYTENQAADQANWNIGTIKKEEVVLVPRGTDIIGPIKLSGDNDFISGVHGSSTTTTINVYADGVPVTLNSALRASCTKLTIQMVDECRRESNKEHVFNRYVTIEISAGKIHVTNLFKSVSANPLTVERATNGGLMASYVGILNGASMNNLILSEAPTTAISNSSKNNIRAVLCTDYGDITVQNIQGHENASYRGSFAVFTTETPIRTKVYFDIMQNETVTNGQEIAGEFEYTFS